MNANARIRDLEHEVAHLKDEMENYRKLYELATLELERLRRNLFGQKAEHVDANQLQLAFAQLAPELAQVLQNYPQVAADLEAHQPSPKRQKQRRTGRKPLPDHLPVERIVLAPAGEHG